MSSDNILPCAFKFALDPAYRCPHQVRRGGFCVFHALGDIVRLRGSLTSNLNPLVAEVQIAEGVQRIKQEFLDSFSALVADVKNRGTDYDFTSFVFPEIYITDVFEKAVLFRGCTFLGPASFFGTDFQLGANFAQCKFQSTADFSKSRFGTKASFSSAVFDSTASFGEVHFSGDTHFDNVTFAGEADFFGTIFDGQTHFASRFKAPASFLSTSFKGFVNFSQSRFQDSTRFFMTRFEESYFTDLGPESACKLEFDTVDLRKASFRSTNIEQVLFRNVKWNRSGGRWVLWDEIRPLSEGEFREHERIAENYRQLVLNCEGKRDFDMAEEFHIGEMEMRKAIHNSTTGPPFWKALRRHLNLYSAYSLVSRYGTSYVRAMSVFAVMVFVFAAVFLISGFQAMPDSLNSHLRLIRYGFCGSSAQQCVSLREWLSDFWDAVLFTVSIVTFQRDRFYSPVGSISKLLVMVATILLTGQSGIVFLALRRRFKR